MCRCAPEVVWQWGAEGSAAGSRIVSGSQLERNDTLKNDAAAFMKHTASQQQSKRRRRTSGRIRLRKHTYSRFTLEQHVHFSLRTSSTTKASQPAPVQGHQKQPTSSSRAGAPSRYSKLSAKLRMSATIQHARVKYSLEDRCTARCAAGGACSTELAHAAVTGACRGQCACGSCRQQQSMTCGSGWPLARRAHQRR